MTDPTQDHVGLTDTFASRKHQKKPIKIGSTDDVA